MEKVLPTILIVIDFATSIPYLFQGDWRKAGIWICQGLVTFFLTW